MGDGDNDVWVMVTYVGDVWVVVTYVVGVWVLLVPTSLTQVQGDVIRISLHP